MVKALKRVHYDRSWVSIGSFDGVHLGHQSLIRELVNSAHREGTAAVVITFSPHPAVFFKRVPLAHNLTGPGEREGLLLALGIDQVITIDFDQQFADLTARDFMGQLKEALGITHLLAGDNFALGKDRSGDISSLRELGTELGFSVDIFPPTRIEGEIISSSRIRKYLTEGQISRANACLGRSFSLEGKVVHGEHRGHSLGFPTANLDLPQDRLLPARGVYACKARVDEKTYMAVTNIGVRPTFDDPLPSPRVEPHLLNLQDDLYGKQLKLEFIEYLRAEKAFDTPGDLVEQVNRDIQLAREMLQNDQ